MTTIAKPKRWTKHERKIYQLDRQYKALAALYERLNPGQPADGESLYRSLRRLEPKANRIFEALCSDREETPADTKELARIESAVLRLFGANELPGFFLNSDPRGYALKIDDNLMRTTYAGIGLQQDWGGYGLLAPEITGD